MTGGAFKILVNKLISMGYGDEIRWQADLKPCGDDWDFFSETMWVILNSGMKEQIARKISDKI